ncbi:hypothetical protein [Erwinia phage Zoomie]|uniref:Uncharacterized protein n=1 Tax=Erwinia phage Zoomie TaxID=2851072 RepID=A0A9E6T3A3_9CAUD|nr:hypothetical protein [Erwinia phage Zoomie]
MLTANYVVFGTAWTQSLPLVDNLKRMALLTEMLVNHGYQFELVAGRYKGVDEQSLAIAVHTQEIAKQIARHVGAIFQQECVGLLEVSTLEFSLLYPTRTMETLGKLLPVPEPDAMAAPNGATFWQGQWWVA